MKYIHPHPECMAPDGADPCAGYKAAIDRIKTLEKNIEKLLLEKRETENETITK